MKICKRPFAHLTVLLCLLGPTLPAIASEGETGSASFNSRIQALYGDQIEFDVLRNGTVVGTHMVQFQKDAMGLVAKANLSMDIRFLGLLIYDYRYMSVSLWRGGTMQRLETRVDDDGTLFAMEAKHADGKMMIEVGLEKSTTSAPIFPTDHWNVAVVKERRVLNTLTGKVNQVVIEQKAREMIETERGPVMATQYAYSGEIDANVWYDDDGRWVRLRFKGPDGSDIDYRCSRCQGGLQESAANE